MTLIDIYYKYKYKKQIKHPPGTTPFPFIKAADITDHKYSADWFEWQKVVLLYLEKLKLYLEDGNFIELGSRLGDFALVKLKSQRFIDFKKSHAAGKVIKFARNNVDNYYICTTWVRKKAFLKLKSFWKIKLNRRWVRSIYLACEKDYTKIYKIRDITVFR